MKLLENGWIRREEPLCAVITLLSNMGTELEVLCRRMGTPAARLIFFFAIFTLLLLFPSFLMVVFYIGGRKRKRREWKGDGKKTDRKGKVLVESLSE